MLLLSPYAKVNYVDHSIIDQSSILRFIEDNWHLGRIGNQSFDAKAGSIMNMFDFSNNGQRAKNSLFLNSASGLQIQNSIAEGKSEIRHTIEPLYMQGPNLLGPTIYTDTSLTGYIIRFLVWELCLIFIEK